MELTKLFKKRKSLYKRLRRARTQMGTCDISELLYIKTYKEIRQQILDLSLEMRALGFIANQ